MCFLLSFLHYVCLFHVCIRPLWWTRSYNQDIHCINCKKNLSFLQNLSKSCTSFHFFYDEHLRGILYVYDFVCVYEPFDELSAIIKIYCMNCKKNHSFMQIWVKIISFFMFLWWKFEGNLVCIWFCVYMNFYSELTAIIEISQLFADVLVIFLRYICMLCVYISPLNEVKGVIKII